MLSCSVSIIFSAKRTCGLQLTMDTTAFPYKTIKKVQVHYLKGLLHMVLEFIHS